MTPESTIVEESEQGTITWSVTPDGHVEAIVKDTDGKPITKDITGVVTWPGEAADDIEYVSLTPEGHLVAAGPALEADLTEIQYDLVIGGKAWSGALHVPRGGTRAIEADATSAQAVVVPPGKKGPNGGTIQVIGGEPVELVADKTTGEVRVYVLGPDFQPIDPGERRMRLGYVAEETETLDLEARARHALLRGPRARTSIPCASRSRSAWASARPPRCTSASSAGASARASAAACGRRRSRSCSSVTGRPPCAWACTWAWASTRASACTAAWACAPAWAVAWVSACGSASTCASA